MRDVYVLGVGQIPVTKEKDESLREMAARAVKAALADAGVETVGALYVGNMLSGMLSHQQHLGALVAHASGLRGIEAATAEAACGSGGAAMRWGYMAVAGGLHDVVVVCGVEKMTHTDRYETTRALATASDWPHEGAHGHSFVSLNAIIMQEYLQRYRANRSLSSPPLPSTPITMPSPTPTRCFKSRSPSKPTRHPLSSRHPSGYTMPRPSATVPPPLCSARQR